MKITCPCALKEENMPLSPKKQSDRHIIEAQATADAKAWVATWTSAVTHIQPIEAQASAAFVAKLRLTVPQTYTTDVVLCRAVFEHRFISHVVWALEALDSGLMRLNRPAEPRVLTVGEANTMFDAIEGESAHDS